VDALAAERDRVAPFERRARDVRVALACRRRPLGRRSLPRLRGQRVVHLAQLLLLGDDHTLRLGLARRIRLPLLRRVGELLLEAAQRLHVLLAVAREPLARRLGGRPAVGGERALALADRADELLRGGTGR